MQGNAPGHAARYTNAWLRKTGIKDDSLMTWPFPDLNPFEILIKEVYVTRTQYNSVNEL